MKEFRNLTVRNVNKKYNQYDTIR